MKRLIIAALLTVAFSTACFTRELVASGKTNTALGDYKIETADEQFVINGEKFRTFVISYQNSPMEVKVVVKPGKNCKNYIVLSDKLSVQYVCNENFFGVEKIDKTLENDGLKTVDACLNRSEYFHQKVITPGKKGEIENAQMIASYFPLLINGGEIQGGAF
ncbi:MAG: hypothetical protein MUD02_04065 [Bacteroidales bacterium]|jgi:hypothetical protein|nr:hypothetical protein [Bacteroidales bacterium]